MKIQELVVVMSPINDPISRKKLQPHLNRMGLMTLCDLRELVEDYLDRKVLDVHLAVSDPIMNSIWNCYPIRHEFSQEELQFVLGIFRGNAQRCVPWPEIRRAFRDEFEVSFDFRVDFSQAKNLVTLMRKQHGRVSQDLRNASFAAA